MVSCVLDRISYECVRYLATCALFDFVFLWVPFGSNSKEPQAGRKELLSWVKLGAV